MKKLTRRIFRDAYPSKYEDDLLNANADHDQYLRTGHVPKYVSDYIKKSDYLDRRLGKSYRETYL